MAQLDKKGNISGAVGPVVYRSQSGKIIVQSKPRKYKQTDATKDSGKAFGKASIMSKNIRQALHPLLLGFTDVRMYSRFTAALFKVLQSATDVPKDIRTLLDGDLDLLSHFDCNTNSRFGDYCKLQPEIQYKREHGLTIQLPEFIPRTVFVVPPMAQEATLCFLITTINPADGTATQAELMQLPVALYDTIVPEQQWAVPNIAEDQLLFVTAAVLYFQRDSLMGAVGLNGRSLHPCEVFGVWKT